MLDRMIKTVIFACLALFGLRVLFSDVVEQMNFGGIVGSGVGTLILVGAGILVAEKIAESKKNRSAQNNS